jgi:16S rRNA (uracil1498-N3)-methyltransferase
MRRGWAADAPAVAHTFAEELTDALEIAGDEGHHLARVRRLRAGEDVTVADGAGVWRPYVVCESGRRALLLEATGACVAEPELTPRLVVAFSATKGAKPELVVQKATELSVDEVIPVRTRRSVARWDESHAGALLTRLGRVAREAAAQCRRARLLQVSAPADLDSLAGRPGLVVADRQGAAPGALGQPAGGEWVLLIGPEGGFDPAEAEVLGPVDRIDLGPFVLRAETAAVAGSSLLTARRKSR